MKEKVKRIEFRIFAPQAKNVHLCWNFNHWPENPDPLNKDCTGT
jgi:1,4-alpha-glucan branching enzyme